MSTFTKSLPLLLGVAALAACSEPTGPEQEVAPPALATAGLGTWTTKAPIPTLRAYSAAAVVRNAAGHYVMYVIGGRNPRNGAMQRVEAYDAMTNTWSRKASLPFKRSLTNGAAVVGGKLYVTGGLDPGFETTKALYVYNPASDSWTRKVDLPVGSSGGISGAIHGKLYVLTGTRLYRYDPATNKWTRKADALDTHTFGIGGVIDGKFYVAYGRQRAAEGSVDVYDPATNRWKTKLRIAYRRLLSPSLDVLEGTVVEAAGAVLNERLYLIGGRESTEPMEKQEAPWVFAYDPAANAWTRKADTQTLRRGAVAGTAKGAAGKSQIVVAGGLEKDEDPEADPIYHAETEAFTP
ncbi:MAG: kelch repeat-containing protein [Gemmatimonadales bacterium]